MASLVEGLAEGGWLPYYALRRGIRYRCGQVLAELRKGDVTKENVAKMEFIQHLKEQPIAINTIDANEQHYELPAEFLQLVLGKNMKYSSCFYASDTKSLDEAEGIMLDLYCERAGIKDGMDLMDLGCGWGSFTFFAAKKYPKSKVTSLSNSATQREFIEGEAKKRGLNNITVITCDINNFDTKLRFDRIISIEMLEHMKNYQILFQRISTWLKDDGKIFIHIFAHKTFAYDYKKGDWLADHFFTGGTMPSSDLFLYFQEYLTIEDMWVLPGTHYGKTAEDWLINMDKKEHLKRIREIFASVYGKDQVEKWVNRWRLFWLACAELFAYDNGQEWVVSHYLFKKKK